MENQEMVKLVNTSRMNAWERNHKGVNDISRNKPYEWKSKVDEGREQSQRKF